MGRVRVYIACSLDGYIAGPDDDLSWLPTDEQAGPGAIDFATFMADVGAMLMGRRTYDMVAGFEGAWPYGDVPVLVATHRPLDPRVPAVRAVAGTTDALVDAALEAAGGRDVYVDGGVMVQAVLEAGRLDELIVTVVPVLLGGGVPLFGAFSGRRHVRFEDPSRFGSMIQLRAVLTPRG